LLQIHDFAEDNRPENYWKLINATGVKSPEELDAYLYPSAPQIHYAGLTRADATVIGSLGVPANRTHCLPNSVTAVAMNNIDRQSALEKIRQVMRLPGDARWALYPVRGIRRKNVGEFVLLSRWVAENTFAALTLSPATPVEKRSYDRWKLMAGNVAPRAVFDAAHFEGVSYPESLAASDFVISTSVAEGFGMAFLEPWLVLRRVVARRLPTVSDDFEAAGVNLTQLYDQIPVPGDADWIRGCRRETEIAFNQAWSSVPGNFRPSMDDNWQHNNEQIDFARLTPKRQIEVLHRIAEDRGFDRDMQQLSPMLIDSLRETTDHQELIDHNAEVVAREYAIEHQAATLKAIYHELISTDTAPKVQPHPCDQSAVKLVSQTRPFYPCRTEIPDE
jgi:hypothetical protein